MPDTDELAQTASHALYVFVTWWRGFSLSRTAGATLDLLYHAWQVFRGVYELDLIEHGVGFRPALRDNLPAIGCYKYSNLHLSIGYYRHGILLAPKAAQLLVEQLL